MSAIDLSRSVNPRRFLRDLELQRCERSLVYFIRQAWHVLEPASPYIHNWHIDMLAEHLEAITNGTEIDGRPYNRLLVNIPPGGMKSMLVNVLWPSWEWGPKNLPHMRYLCAAHKIENLSARDAYKMRSLVTSDWYQARWGDRVKINPDQRAKLNFANEATGFRVATAIGSLTGIRADRVLIDDPHSVDSATSEITMQSEVTNFLEAVPTRLNDPIKSAIVVIMQRLHEGDISGIILDDLNRKTPGLWDSVVLPMRYAPWRAKHPTLLGTQDPREDDGELFFPARFPLPVVERDEASLGPYGTAAQFAQEPAPRGGGIIQDDWWQVWKEPGYPLLDFVLASLDTAYTTKEENDYSALTIWGVFSTERTATATRVSGRYGALGESEAREYAETAPKVIMLYAWQKRLEFPDLVKDVIYTCTPGAAEKGGGPRFGVDLLLIESKAAGISLAQELRRAVGHEPFDVRLMDPKGGDKIARLYSVQHIFSEGMVYAPDREWAEMVFDQVRKFPKGKHDDLCFAAGTKIATKRGLISIEDITTDDYALTPFGWRRVFAAGVTGCKPVVHRAGLTGTFNHPVFTLDLLYQPLISISPKSQLSGLVLCDLMKTMRLRKLLSKILYTDEWAESAATISANREQALEGGARKDCMLRYGSFTTDGKFRRCMMYIIETATCLILSLRIWSAYRVALIGQWLRSTLTVSSSAPISPRLARKPPIGIGLTTGANGIVRFLRRAWARRGLQNDWAKIDPLSEYVIASGAIRNLASEINVKPYAQPPVSLQSLTSTSGGVNSSTRTMQPVYNLTVTDAQCYYANGFLVHNCDTVSQALRFLRDAGMLTRAPERIAEIADAMRHANTSAVKRLYPV